MKHAVFSGVPDFEVADKAVSSYEELYESSTDTDYFKEYLEVSRIIQSLFISDDGYVINTGNFQTVNYEILRNVVENVKKHPRLWKKFMVV